MFQSIIDFFMEFGIWGLMLHSFLDAIIFPVPAFFLQVSLSLLDPSAALWLATAGYAACLLGTPIGYIIGKVCGKPLLQKLIKKSWLDKATDMFLKNGDVAVLIGSFTPIPFKVFTLLSGCMKFPLWKLIGYAAIGRAVKFYSVGVLFYFYGRAAESMVKDVSLYIFVIATPVLFMGYLFLKKRKAKKYAQHPSILKEKSFD